MYNYVDYSYLYVVASSGIGVNQAVVVMKCCEDKFAVPEVFGYLKPTQHAETPTITYKLPQYNVDCSSVYSLVVYIIDCAPMTYTIEISSISSQNLKTLWL